MKRRYRWPVVAGLLGLLPNLGCLSNGPRPPMEMPTLPGTAEKPGPELPPRKSAEVCLRMAAAMEKNGHDAEAVLEYERARQYDPRHANVARRLAVLYDRLGVHQRAAEEFQKALKENPKDPDLLNDLGYSCYNRGQWREAEKHLRKALALDPHHARAWNNLGLALGQQGRFPEALEAFKHVVTPAEAHSNLAFVLSTQGKRDQAGAEYRQALALEPDLRVAQLALAKLERPAAPGKAAPPDPGNKPAKKPSPWRATAKAAEMPAVPPAPLPDLPPVVVDLPKPRMDMTLPAPGAEAKKDAPKKDAPPKTEEGVPGTVTFDN